MEGEGHAVAVTVNERGHAVGWPVKKYVMLRANGANGNVVMVGHTAAGAVDGFILSAGQQSPAICVDQLNKMYHRRRGGRSRILLDCLLKADQWPSTPISTAHKRKRTSNFAARLHEFAWTIATTADRRKSLIAARAIIDALNYKGVKHAVYTLRGGDPEASSVAAEDMRAAEASQPLEFPRGADTEVPEAIRIAEYEIAHALLDGKEPEIELENLAVSTMGYGAVKTSYERSGLPVEHITNLCPSSAAWRLLRPFLRDSDALKLSRLS